MERLAAARCAGLLADDQAAHPVASEQLVALAGWGRGRGEEWPAVRAAEAQSVSGFAFDPVAALVDQAMVVRAQLHQLARSVGPPCAQCAM